MSHRHASAVPSSGQGYRDPVQARNEEQLLRILSEIDEARAQIRDLLVTFPRALKRWADTEKMSGEHYYKLGEVIVDMHSKGIDERRFATILSATANSPDSGGAWRDLVDLSDEWDDAIRRLAKSCGRYVAFCSYERSMMDRPKVTDVLHPYDGDEDDARKRPPRRS